MSTWSSPSEGVVDLPLILALGRRGGLAVEEARHVAELLRLRDAQLPEAGLGDDLAEEVVHAAAGPAGAEQIVLELVPVAREAEVGDLRTARAIARIVVADERLRELDRAVLAVVGVHHDVAVLHAGVVADHVARDVLVGHRSVVGRLACLVLLLDGLLDSGRAAALAVDDAFERRVGELVLLRAVHAVVATHRSADRGVANGGEFSLEARGSVLRRAMYSSVERGGVSRPSRNGCTTIFPSGNSARALRISLKRCSWWA